MSDEPQAKMPEASTHGLTGPTSYIGDPNAPVPDGMQGTWRPNPDDAGTALWVHEQVDNAPQPDHGEPSTAAAVADHEAQQPLAVLSEAEQASWQQEHDRQLQAARDREIAAAGESSNIGTDGIAHSLKLTQKEGTDGNGTGDYEQVCSGCGQPWPCDQAKAMEDVPAEPGSPTANAEQNERAKLLGGS